MAFPDPVVVPIAGALALIGRDKTTSEYRLSQADGVHWHLLVRQTPETRRGRQRAIVTLRHEALITEAVEDGDSVPVEISAQFSIDYPKRVLPVSVSTISSCLRDFLTEAVLARLVNGET